jgi:hypothetical protein
VENDPVVIPILDVRDEILHRLGRDIRVQLEENVALVGMYRGARSARFGLFDDLDSCTLLFSRGPLVEDVSLAAFGLTRSSARAADHSIFRHRHRTQKRC